MNITVYLGANKTEDPHIRKAAEELGVWIAANGHTLVYGGSKSGLMVTLAFAVVENGGKAIGVEPQMFMDKELQYDDLTELIVTETMAERKQKMIKMGDAFIAFPGGTGTLEEISEIMSMVTLGHLDAPCIIYNLKGYYNSLRKLLDRMIEEGLSSEEKLKGISFAENLDQIKECLTVK